MTIDHTLTFNQHYKDIQNYFSVSNANQDEFDFERHNTSIVRARSKLSGLTEVQFLELSTDVHDELQRRITDNGGEFGSCLRPIETFHKKRNQAREKLSSLAANRFNDLLNDISQEIQRRGYDNIEINEMEKFEDERNSIESIIKSSTPLKNTPSSTEKDGKNSDDIIQQTVIIPKKASIDWSSDEEEEEEEQEEEKKGIEPGQIETTNDSIEYVEPEFNFNGTNQDKLVEATSEGQLEKKTDENLNETLAESVTLTKIPTTQTLSSTEFEISPNIATSKTVTSNDEEDDFDFNQPLTHINFDKELEMKPENMESASVHLNTVVEDETNDDIASLKEENNNLKHKLKSLNDNSSHYLVSNVNTSQFEQFIDESGHIPLSLVKDFHHLTARLYSIINESDSQSNQEELGNNSFTKVFQLSKNIHEIMLLSSIPELANEIILLKVSLSHLITSIRYYCSFKDLLPKITVNTSIADLSFVFCNLVAIAKIKAVDMNDEPKTVIESTLNPNDETLTEETDTSHILSPNLQSKVKPLRLAEKLQRFESSLSLTAENDNSVATSTSDSSINIRSIPSKGLLFDRIDVKSVTSSPEKRKQKQKEIMEVTSSTSESLFDGVSKLSPIPSVTIEKKNNAAPSRNKSFMDKLKELKHISAK
ncbi:hypothetical protein MOSE0_I00650 [Monosporozyma servazzii]